MIHYDISDTRFYDFLHYIESSRFEVSCDAYANLKETLTRHKPMVAEFLDNNYDRFFTSFQTLVLSNNYVTKRQSLKLLGEILLDRANFSVMTQYIADEGNLKVIMNMLRNKSKNIQFEAFHVFKVFVANPKKPPQIESILRRNKGKLLEFLKDFHNDKEGAQIGSLFGRQLFIDNCDTDEQFSVCPVLLTPNFGSDGCSRTRNSFSSFRFRTCELASLPHPRGTLVRVPYRISYIAPLDVFHLVVHLVASRYVCALKVLRIAFTNSCLTRWF